MWEILIDTIAPVLVTFLVGLFANKPGYKKYKNIVKAIEKADDDDKLSPEEWSELKGLILNKKK